MTKSLIMPVSKACFEPTRHWVPPGRSRGQSNVACQPVVQLVEDVVYLIVAAELPHVDVTDLCHSLATRERRHHDWVSRLLQDPGTAELKEAHWAGQERGGDQFDDQSGLLQLAAEVSAHVGPGRDAGGPR